MAEQFSITLGKEASDQKVSEQAEKTDRVKFDVGPPEKGVSDSLTEKPTGSELSDDKSGKLQFTPLGRENVIRQVASPQGLKTEVPEVSIQGDETSEETKGKTLEITPIEKKPDQISESRAAILEASEKALETKPWEKSKFKDYLDGGKIAGAAAVVEVLKTMGYKVDGANPSRVIARLIAQGWTMHGIEEARAGDVVFGGKMDVDWQNGAGNSDIGIVGSDSGSVYQVDKATGKWKKGTMDELLPAKEYGARKWVLRPPAKLPDKNEQTNLPNPKEKGISINDLPDGVKELIPKKDNVIPAQNRFKPGVDKPSPDDPESRYWYDYWKERSRKEWQDYYSKKNKKEVPPYKREDSERVPDYSDRKRQETKVPDYYEKPDGSNKNLPLSGRVIALAAGHGGHDSGASLNGWREKDFTLAMTLKIAAQLESLGATVKLTRDSDVYVHPKNIKAKFNQFKPDIALAIHADSAGSRAEGVLTMYSKQDSRNLAETLQREIVADSGAGDRGIRYQTHAHTGKVFQSTNPEAPAVFLELANLGNRAEAQRIRTEAYQDKLARAVAKGVVRYLGNSREYRKVS